jgi:hypothetical protein
MFDALPFLLAWPLGAMMRRLREYRVTLEERNRQLDQEREVNARRAVLLLPLPAGRHALLPGLPQPIPEPLAVPPVWLRREPQGPARP